MGNPHRRISRTAKPIAPFSKDPREAASGAFDRETGAQIDTSDLKNYASALAQYHLSPEAKFQNGDYLDSGRTERRRVRVNGVNHIGKEANNLEKQFFLGIEENDQIEYGGVLGEALNERLHALCEKFGEREIAKRAGISRMSLRKARKGVKKITFGLLAGLHVCRDKPALAYAVTQSFGWRILILIVLILIDAPTVA